MDIEDCIEKIIKDGDIKEMEQLSEILEDIMELLKEYDEEVYKKYEMCLYKMAYGEVLTKEMAEEIVSNMRPYHMRWTLEETKRLQEEYGLTNIRPVDFFIVINSAYNDYRDIFQDNIDMYVKFTENFINDEDAKESKIFIYYTTIPE